MSRDQPSAPGGRITRDRVAAALRARIDSGELRPGESLPTQKALMDEFDVERGVVRKALEPLKREELLADVGRGSPPTVAEPAERRVESSPHTAGVELAERLDVAFQATDVTLDAFSLTTETLNQAIAPTLMAIAAGRPGRRRGHAHEAAYVDGSPRRNHDGRMRSTGRPAAGWSATRQPGHNSSELAESYTVPTWTRVIA